MMIVLIVFYLIEVAIFLLKLKRQNWQRWDVLGGVGVDERAFV